MWPKPEQNTNIRTYSQHLHLTHNKLFKSHKLCPSHLLNYIRYYIAFRPKLPDNTIGGFAVISNGI